MEIYTYITGEDTPRRTTPSSTTTTSSSSSSTARNNHPILYTTLASAAIGLPLLALTGLFLFLSLTLLLLSSPLLLLLSPLLLLAGLILTVSLTGFTLASLTGWARLQCLGWTRPVNGGSTVLDFGRFGRVEETVTESMQRAKEEKADFGGGYGYRRVTVYPPEDLVESK